MIEKAQQRYFFNIQRLLRKHFITKKLIFFINQRSKHGHLFDLLKHMTFIVLWPCIWRFLRKDMFFESIFSHVDLIQSPLLSWLSYSIMHELYGTYHNILKSKLHNWKLKSRLEIRKSITLHLFFLFPFAMDWTKRPCMTFQWFRQNMHHS